MCVNVGPAGRTWHGCLFVSGGLAEEFGSVAVFGLASVNLQQPGLSMRSAYDRTGHFLGWLLMMTRYQVKLGCSRPCSLKP